MQKVLVLDQVPLLTKQGIGFWQLSNKIVDDLQKGSLMAGVEVEYIRSFLVDKGWGEGTLKGYM